MSASYVIEPRQRFWFEGKRITYRRRARDPGRTYVFEDDDGVPYPMTHEEIRLARAGNRLLDWSEPSLATVRPDVVVRRARISYDSATAEERAIAECHLDYVLAWQDRPGTPRTPGGLGPVIDAVYRRRKTQAAAEQRLEPPRPSASNLQKLISKYLRGGQRIDALVPQTRLRGNYRERLCATVTDIVWRHIDASYLVLHGKSAAGVQDAIAKEVRRLNLERGPGDQLPEPSYAAILEFTKRLCKFTVAFCRKGPRVARERFRLSGGGIVTTHANQVWEIDDTRVDLICLHEDGKTVIGRPWLTVVIDRHTRMIMSFVLSFSPPDTETALEAMRLAILPKHEILEANPQLRSDWPSQNRPEAVHVDNGKHYNSKAFKRGVTRLGIRHHTLPVLKAWYKGTVERLLGTIMRQVFRTVPGTTYSGIYERDKETPPETVAVATLAEASSKLLSWIVNVYQHRVHRGIDASPYAMWHRSLEEHPLRMPLARQDVLAALSLTVGRKIRKGGIVVDGLRYLTPHGLLLEMAAGPDARREVLVRRDSGDLTTISFLDAGVSDRSEERWHEATICAEHYPRVAGRTLLEYRLARALRQQNPEDYGDNDPEWTATYEKVGDDREDAAASKRLADRVRAEGERERIVRAAERRVARERDTAEPAEGEDLQARIEAADGAPMQEGAAAPDAPTPEQSLDRFEEEHGLGARMRRPSAKED